MKLLSNAKHTKCCKNIHSTNSVVYSLMSLERRNRVRKSNYLSTSDNNIEYKESKSRGQFITYHMNALNFNLARNLDSDNVSGSLVKASNAFSKCYSILLNNKETCENRSAESYSLADYTSMDECLCVRDDQSPNTSLSQVVDQTVYRRYFITIPQKMLLYNAHKGQCVSINSTNTLSLR